MRVEEFAARLRKDYSHLEKQAKALSQRCVESIDIEMSFIKILESKKCLQQAERATMLTFFAYDFIPLTFVATLFGMNIPHFVKQGPPLWNYFAIAIPLLVLSLLILGWKMIRNLAFHLQQQTNH